jgi:predicted TPR repeat methyltransferase
MSLQDLGYWIRSARADAALKRFGKRNSTTAFDNLYAKYPDPYGTTLSCYRYQRLKYDRLTALLPAARYRSALDIGCGLGVYTRLLSPYVDQILGIEQSVVAVQQAEQLSLDFANIRYIAGDVTRLSEATQETFDLITLLDVLYYVSPCTGETLESIAHEVTRRLAPGGILLLAHHYFFRFDPHSRHTQQIHRSFQRVAALTLVREAWKPFYLGSVFQKTRPQ